MWTCGRERRSAAYLPCGTPSRSPIETGPFFGEMPLRRDDREWPAFRIKSIPIRLKSYAGLLVVGSREKWRQLAAEILRAAGMASVPGCGRPRITWEDAHETTYALRPDALRCESWRKGAPVQHR